MNDEKIEQLKSNLIEMKAYMDEITPRNATLASNAAWRWVHQSMETSLELFEPDVVEPNKEGLFPDETLPDPKPVGDPLPKPGENKAAGGKDAEDPVKKMVVDLGLSEEEDKETESEEDK